MSGILLVYIYHMLQMGIMYKLHIAPTSLGILYFKDLSVDFNFVLTLCLFSIY